MKTKTILRKIILCLSSLGSAFLFFCFMGKAYGNEAISPSWYDLIFGGREISASVSGPIYAPQYYPSEAGIALFSMTVACGVIGLWLFASTLQKSRSGRAIGLGLTSIHALLLLLSLILCSCVLPLFGEEGPLGNGSVSFIVLSSCFLLFDLLGLAFLLRSKKGE